VTDWQLAASYVTGSFYESARQGSTLYAAPAGNLNSSHQVHLLKTRYTQRSIKIQKAEIVET
jgi:hypothetical protein